MKSFVSHINGLTLTVFGNSVLRTFEPKGEEVIEGWRKVHSKEFHKLRTSPNNIRMIRSTNDDTGGLCNTNGRNKMRIKCWSENLNGKRYLKDLHLHKES
jgi:hypothetical protein